MKIKKINAVLALFSILAMILHIGYNSFSYLTMYYNLSLKLSDCIAFHNNHMYTCGTWNVLGIPS